MIMTPRHRFLLVFVLVAAVAIAALRWVRLDATGAQSGPVEEIVLVARDMAFQIEGQPGTLNPTLRLKAGSRVRVVLRNDERGVTHSFAIPGWGVDTGIFDAPGTAHVEFRVPHAKGPLSYECTPHARMMRGTIEVR